MILIISVLTFLTLSCKKDNHILTNYSAMELENPEITILHPANNVQIGEGATVAIVAGVNDNSGVEEVKFYIDDRLEARENGAPWIYYWDTNGKPGLHKIQLKAYASNNNAVESEAYYVEINTSMDTAPFATLTVTPSSGTADSVFRFDASGSRDKENYFSQLRYSWDWENDGIWDISNSTNYNPTHQFNKFGVYPVRLMVTDEGKLWDDTIRAVGIYETGTVSGNEGIVYKTVKIGDQWWMAENLKSTRFRNGDPISEHWVYDDDENNVAQYGRLYSWNAVKDSRKITPYGWHIPSDAEVQTLIQYLGGAEIAGDKIKSADINLWEQMLTSPTNESGFSAIPAGFRMARADPYYDGIGRIATFWTSTDFDEIYSGIYGVNHFSSKLTSGKGFKYYSHSVRCIKD